MENETIYVNMQFPKRSMINKKIDLIRKKTGIKSRTGALTHALLNFKFEGEE
jgi:hypothetical protein